MPEVLFTCSEGKGGAGNLEKESGGFCGMGCDLGLGKKGKVMIKSPDWRAHLLVAESPLASQDRVWVSTLPLDQPSELGQSSPASLSLSFFIC